MSEEAIQDTGSQEAVAAPNFLESIPENLRSEPSLRNFQDAGSLAKSYVHAQRMIGRDNVTIPSKSATPEEWRQAYQKLGAPDTADAYQFDNMDDKVANEFRQQAFELGLSQKQAKAVADFYLGQETSRNEALKQAGEDAIYDSEQELKQEFGKAFKQKILGAQNAAKQLLGGTEIFHKVHLADGRKLGDHPDIIRMFSALAGQIGEDQLIGEKSEMIMTPADAQRQITDMERLDGPYHDERHPEHDNYVNEVYRLRSYL